MGAPRRGLRRSAARSQLSSGRSSAKLARQVAPGEHVQHRLQRAAGQLPVGAGADHQGVDLRRRPLPLAAQGRDLLGQHVQRVAGHAEWLQLAAQHAPGDDRALQQVAPELRVDTPAAHLPDPVPGAAHPLQPAGHRARGLDQQHPVHRAHVDAHLQRAGGDDGADAAALEPVLDLGALLVGDAAVMGAHQLLPRQLVEALAQALAQAAAVDEDDGRSAGADLLQQRGVDGRPHPLLLRRSAHLPAVELGQDGTAPGLLGRLAGDAPCRAPAPPP